MEVFSSKRIKQRFNVDLKAEISNAGLGIRNHQCRITNLSATGACLSFETMLSCSAGMNIDIQIFMPGTIIHIPNSGEIMWVKQQHNAMDIGVKFKDNLSEIMMQQLI